MGCNQILDRYIEQLIETSTPQAPAWNIEKIRAGKENTWNYIDGCMIKALIELYEITGEQRYLTFADDYIDFFVQDDGTIKHYNPQDYNLDNVNAGKTLYKLYDLVGKPKYRAAMDTIYPPARDPAAYQRGRVLAQGRLSQPDLARWHVYGPAVLHAVRAELPQPSCLLGQLPYVPGRA